jgi:hypothetical protein
MPSNVYRPIRDSVRWTVLALVLASGHGVAAAQVLPVELEWQADEGCPDRAAVVRDIAQLLSASELLATAEPIVASARARATEDGGWRLSLSLRQGAESDTRTLEGQSCDSVARAAALVLDLEPPSPTQSEPVEPVPEEPVAVEEPQERAPDLAPPPDEESTDEPEQPIVAADRGPDFRVAALVLGDVGALPEPSLGAGLRASYGSEWRVAVGLGFFPKRFASASDGSTAGGDVGLFSAAAVVQWQPLRSDVSVGPRLGLEGGLYLGQGSGVSEPRPRLHPSASQPASRAPPGSPARSP